MNKYEYYFYFEVDEKNGLVWNFLEPQAVETSDHTNKTNKYPLILSIIPTPRAPFLVPLSASLLILTTKQKMCRGRSWWGWCQKMRRTK